MSIFNPWGEIRRLKAQLEAGYETYRIEETQQQADWAKKEARLLELERENADLRRNRQALNARILQLLNQLDTAVLRDPKTGRLMPRKGK
jgi:chromosome segregation ATPase